MEETINYIKNQIGDFCPEIALVLGSACGDFADNLEGIEVSYSDIPNFQKSTVSGHKGKFLFAKYQGKNLVIAQGRIHYYEGHSIQSVVYMTKVFKKLGVKVVVLTNASGSANKNIKPSDIVIITDHINFMGVNPLIGKNDDTLGTRFPDMTHTYDLELQNLARKCAKSNRIDIKEGVYLATTGPSYETPAEIRMFQKWGADVIGMSTVPEAITANYCGMKVLGLSVATNYCAGISKTPLNHEEVIETGKIASRNMKLLMSEIVKEIKL